MCDGFAGAVSGGREVVELQIQQMYGHGKIVKVGGEPGMNWNTILELCRGSVTMIVLSVMAKV